MSSFETLVINVQYTWMYWALLIFFAAYPIVTSLMWVTTSLFFVFRWERDEEDDSNIDRSYCPPVTILIPAHNEAAVVARSVDAACRINYPDYEIIVINDGSTDNTVDQVLPFVHSGKIRLLNKILNEGKALALNDAIPMSNGEIILIMDADAEPDPEILWHMVPHFATPRVASVTGNPRVRNVDTFIARLQAIEFTSIVSLLRRSQRIWGRIVTVSGVIAAFRKSALFDVGAFSANMLTEDIELTWKLQRRFYDVRYEPKAIVWMTVPASLTALFKQRLRWARGLMQVLRKHRGVMAHWRFRRMWPMFVESVLSVLWAFCFVSLTSLWTASYAIGFPPIGASPIPNLWGMVIATLCMIQLGIGTLIDRKYDKTIVHYFPYAVFYPIVYWAFLAFTTVVSIRYLFMEPKLRSVTWETERQVRDA